MTPPHVTAIIRAKDRERLLGRAIESLRRQTVPVEVVVVDSGSTDRTVAIARELADRVIEIAPDAFSYGGALNTGAAAASGDVHVALSSHCELPREDWVEIALGHLEDPAVAATNSSRFRPHGAGRLQNVIVQHEPQPSDDLYWGFSNHAATWRAEVWRRFPFDETLTACEDKEWALRVREAGHTIVFDPRLYVSGGHRRREGPRALFERTAKEAEALREHAGGRPISLAATGRLWWTYFPNREGKRSLKSLASPLRMIEISGRWAGERRASS